MDFFKSNELTEDMLPVLLGVGRPAKIASREFFRKYGVISHVFSHNTPVLYHLSLFIKPHHIPKTLDEALLLQSLLDFAGQYKKTDRLLCLLPCSERMDDFVRANRQTLESCYLLSRYDDLYRFCVGEEAQK